MKVRRPPAPAPHEIVDLSLDIQLEGAFDAVYVDGDNSGCLPTDTMKNTVYAFARRDPIDHVEAFGLRLAEHFAAKPLVSRVRVAATEHRWERLSIGGRPHPHAFVQPGSEQWTAVITRDANGCDVTSGLTNLVVLKTASSAFAGFPRDELTTLADTHERILATSVTASWRYRAGMSDFSVRDAVRAALVETFAGHESASVQHTLYAMGAAALERVPRSGRDHPHAPEPSPSAGRFEPVRPGQSERGVRRDRPAVRCDRSDNPSIISRQP